MRSCWSWGFNPRRRTKPTSESGERGAAPAPVSALPIFSAEANAEKLTLILRTLEKMQVAMPPAEPNTATHALTCQTLEKMQATTEKNSATLALTCKTLEKMQATTEANTAALSVILRTLEKMQVAMPQAEADTATLALTHQTLEKMQATTGANTATLALTEQAQREQREQAQRDALLFAMMAGSMGGGGGRGPPHFPDDKTATSRLLDFQSGNSSLAAITRNSRTLTNLGQNYGSDFDYQDYQSPVKRTRCLFKNSATRQDNSETDSTDLESSEEDCDSDSD
ncbi:hypothetical protein HDU78_009921 [Chytriomyces hyalinus]|nr:hypothetical protein HDU78_009921 [Chytriomyces hyalinus]